MNETTPLKLQVGDTVQLQYPGDDQRSRNYVRVIGYMPGQSVLVTTPRTNGKVQIVREGQVFVVRLLAANTVHAFTATVLRSCARPYAYLHLSYPKQLESLVVRKSQRVPVQLIVAVQNEEPEKALAKPAAGLLIDVSTTGAMFTADNALGELGDMLVISARVQVGNAEHYLAVPSRLRRLEQDPPAGDVGHGRWQHGVEFELVDEELSVVLHGFVYEQLVKRMG
jgi:c-di-GMP-binding flagellar brake protein YcgR